MYISIKYSLCSLCLVGQLIAGSNGRLSVVALRQSATSGQRITDVLPKPNQATVIPAGEQITLHSKTLNEDRTVFVALPASYATSDEKYPVLYVTYAVLNFDSTRCTAVFLAR